MANTPLIIYGKGGNGKSILAEKIASCFSEPEFIKTINFRKKFVIQGDIMFKCIIFEDVNDIGKIKEILCTKTNDDLLLIFTTNIDLSNVEIRRCNIFELN